MSSPSAIDRLIGRCLMVGIRGAAPDDPVLRADLDACCAAHIRGVILFDVDLPMRAALERDGMSREDANRRATRNILNPTQLKDLCAHIKAALGPGTIISIDQEGGRVARLKPERGFRASKSAAEVGAMPEGERHAECRAEAAQLAALGIGMNCAPCVDLGNHPDNPIITMLGRAFSADPVHVAACARDVIEAHHAHRVIPCLKHFPGHGSTIVDSHLNLPNITDTFDEATESMPYERLIADATGFDGVCVMTGHLYHEAIDEEMPASLSSAFSEILRLGYNFDGPIITDSLDMGAITKHWGPEEAVVRALCAGADIALYGFNAPDIARDAPHPAPMLAGAIKAAVEKGRIDIRGLRTSAERIEAALSFVH